MTIVRSGIERAVEDLTRDSFHWTPNPGAQQFAFNVEADEVLFHGGRGCVHPDTLLNTPSGVVKIQDFPGGLIHSWDGVGMVISKATPAIRGTEEDIYHVRLENGLSVRCTDEHKFFSQHGWRMQKELSIGDSVVAGVYNPALCKIAKVELIGREVYWDLHVPGTNCYFAEGILHHNSGKSDWLWGSGVLKNLARYGRNNHIIMFRHSSKALEDLIHKGIQITEQTGLARYVAGNVREFRFTGDLEGAVVKMRMVDNISDLDAVKGHEYNCVVEGTEVLMADGSHKPIEDVVDGDMVQTLDGPERVISAWNSGAKPCVKVSLPDGQHQLQSATHSLLAIEQEQPSRQGDLCRSTGLYDDTTAQRWKDSVSLLCAHQESTETDNELTASRNAPSDTFQERCASRQSPRHSLSLVLYQKAPQSYLDEMCEKAQRSDQPQAPDSKRAGLVQRLRKLCGTLLPACGKQSPPTHQLSAPPCTCQAQQSDGISSSAQGGWLTESNELSQSGQLSSEGDPQTSQKMCGSQPPQSQDPSEPCSSPLSTDFLRCRPSDPPSCGSPPSPQVCTDRCAAPSQDGGVLHGHSCKRPDEEGISQTRSPGILQSYLHPYYNEFHPAKALYRRSTYTITPIGLKNTYDLYVKGGNHYITALRDSSGAHNSEATYVVNKNCVCVDEVVDLRVPFHTFKNKILGSLRNKFGIPSRMLYTCNPGGFNHFAVRSYFIDPCPEGYKLIKNQHGKTRVHIPSTLKDNPVLLNNNPDYLTHLQSIRDPQLREAWLNGSWDVTIGSAFQDVWNHNSHVVGSIHEGDVPMGCPLYRAMDWGMSSPFSVMWYFISNGENIKGVAFPPGAMVFIREYYGWRPGSRHNKGLKLTPYEVARECKRIELDNGFHDRVQPGPADNQVFGGQLTGTPIYSDFQRFGITFNYADKSPGSNAMGVTQIRNRLTGVDNTPMLYFTEDCHNSIRTLKALILDEQRRDELAKNQEDHCFDVIKYACLANLGMIETADELYRRRMDNDNAVGDLARFRGR